jgi:hypothetical protein
MEAALVRRPRGPLLDHQVDPCKPLHKRFGHGGNSRLAAGYSPAVPEAFNPLDKIHLAESIERALLDQPCEALPPERFEGAGIYALYYSGDYDLYAPITVADCGGEPIYVGKAVPSGSRRGGFLKSNPGRALLNRLAQHAESIRANEAWGVENDEPHLQLDDFTCKVLLLDDVWIPLGEAILISRSEPVWNRIVDGFGKHVSGKGREQGKRSLWDELHPGRAWALREQKAKWSKGEILTRVALHLEARAKLSEPTAVEEEELTALEQAASTEDFVEGV